MRPITVNKQIAFNKSTRKSTIEYIVIHDTGNTGAGANAQAHFQYFNSADRNASADFFVDSKETWQLNDYTKSYTWHCGDGGGKKGITNSNSVGIELCINSDGNYEEAYKRLVALTRHLMTTLNIPIDKVVRHFDASGKMCPATMSANNWEEWHLFKKQLEVKEITTVDNVKDALDKIIQKLNDVGDTTDKTFWVTACEHIKFLDKLLIKIANAI